LKSIDYQVKLDKALSQLKRLELDKALTLFYQLLVDFPRKVSLIEQIYQLEIRRNNNLGLYKIATHIFSQTARSDTFHQLTLKSYQEFKLRKGTSFSFNVFKPQQAFNLFYHLGQTSYQNDIDALNKLIKNKLCEHPNTPQALFYFCEQLVAHRKLLQAKRELEFIIIYYAECYEKLAAEQLLKKVRARLA